MSLKILVVDDEEQWREQFKDILELLEYRYDTFDNFNTAKNEFVKNEYDLVILDICLDDTTCHLSFQKFSRFLKKEFPLVPVVAVSGAQIDTDFMWELRNHGISDFISKTHLSLNKLKEKIEFLTKCKTKTFSNNKMKVFISYAEEDYQMALKIYNFLKNNNFSPWIDKEELLPGQNKDIETIKAISSCDYFIACLSSKTVSSQGIHQKSLKKAIEMWDTRSEGEIYLIPVRLDKCDLPSRFDNIESCDLFEDKSLEKLIKSLEKYKG